MSDTYDQRLECPVCHMKVEGNRYVLNYQGRQFVFCSLQCFQRFESGPHLYTGRPGYPAPAQQGHEIIKKRKLKLSEQLTDEHCFVIEVELARLMGIRQIEFGSDYLYISYDLLQITVEQVESAIETTGNGLKGGLGTKLKHAFIHYLEETELDNLEKRGDEH